MSNFEFETFLGQLLSTYARLKKTAGIKEDETVSLHLLKREFTIGYQNIVRSIRRFGTDRVVIGLALLLRRRAPSVCTVVYLTDAYLEIQDTLRGLDPTFTFGSEVETVFDRLATHIDGEKKYARM